MTVLTSTSYANEAVITDKAVGRTELMVKMPAKPSQADGGFLPENLLSYLFQDNFPDKTEVLTYFWAILY